MIDALFCIIYSLILSTEYSALRILFITTCVYAYAHAPQLVYMSTPMSLSMPLHILLSTPMPANAFAGHPSGALCCLLALV